MDVLVHDLTADDSYNIADDLRTLLNPFFTVQLVSESTLASHSWTKTCALLILRSSRKSENPVILPPKAIEEIQSFVYTGGAMLTFGLSVMTSNARPEVNELHLWDANLSKFAVLLHNSDIATPNATTFSVGKLVNGGPDLDPPFAAHILKGSLTSLGLLDESLPAQKANLPPVPRHPLPQFLLSSPRNTQVTQTILQSIGASEALTSSFTLHDAADAFIFTSCTPADSPQLVNTRRELAPPSDAPAFKEVLVLPPGSHPPHEATPRFDVERFFAELGSCSSASGWRMGDALFYGEAVSSTQTMLDKNPKLLTSLPTPVVSLASHQLAGRGRGANTWLSPEGCLQFSLLLRLSLSKVPAQRLVFVQYLFGLAVAKACKDERALGGDRGASVRLKWPNDIYLDLDSGKKKIGGILVNTSFTGGQVEVIIGCGVNVSTPAPMASLSLLSPDAQLSSETMLALILSKFESMWETFVESRGSWAPFEDAYLDAWMHSDQSVTVATVSPPQQVRILGITADHGLLRTLPERGAGEFIDLQPDGNSFDLMEGLIRAKK
ncbi:class II aaRS and biotin synthetase [Peniophora sp. CONT]|nr:class II aaRS and biotin synthetase [Peniophora sp. CONT]